MKYYSNIGNTCYQTGDYSKALTYYEKALEIQQQILPANHPELAVSYMNMGTVCLGMDECSKALVSYEKAMKIYEESIPVNRRALATCYMNIGITYSLRLSNDSKGRFFMNRALEIDEHSLSSNHPMGNLIRRYLRRL